jgi:hypothetical protein
MMSHCLRLWKWGLAAVLAWPGPPFVSVQATDPLASEPGNNPGSFTISRSGDTNAALTVPFPSAAPRPMGWITPPSRPTSPWRRGNFLQHRRHAHQRTKSTGYKTVKLTLPRENFDGGSAPPFLVGSLNRALVYIVYNYTNDPAQRQPGVAANGASFLSKPNIVLAATASDSNGWVTAVQFFANGAWAMMLSPNSEHLISVAPGI